jgi:catechol 2,3-dioxygenase-like lactoylglutathione lyase family enzyme
MPNVVTHVGLCVTDLERSQRFYTEAFGFAFERDLQPPDELTGKLLEVDGPQLTAVYLTLGDFTLELLRYDRDGNPPYRKRVMNEPGLTHLSLTVDDLAATLDRVRAAGGEVVESTNVVAAVMVRDPDGQLVELIARR